MFECGSILFRHLASEEMVRGDLIGVVKMQVNELLVIAVLQTWFRRYLRETTVMFEPNLGVMVVGVVDESLEVLDLHDAAPFLFVLYERVILLLLLAVRRQQLLDLVIAQQVFLLHSEDLEGLFLGYKSAFNSKAFLSHLSAILVRVFLARCSKFLTPIVQYFPFSSRKGDRVDISLGTLLAGRLDQQLGGLPFFI